MIPNIAPTRFESNVSSIQHAFTIELTPTLAKLLSSQTYTDKILAAVREPLSNAYDSHVRAGTLDTPAKLHLPTALEPYFSIRDFGTGLNHDDVIRLFFSYGVSDKRETNNEIGGLGIGAKAFFAYTDQAVITSWYNGMKRTYSANKGSNGLPQGMLISVEETDEPNGIELSFPVNHEAKWEFKTKVEQILQYLELEYESNITLSIDKPKLLYSLDINGVRVDLPQGYGIHKVIMGGIAYDVSADIYHNACVKHFNFTFRPSFHLHLPIGTVEISASREALSPTEDDKKLLATILYDTNEALRATDWSETIEAAPSWLDAVKVRHELGGFMDFDNLNVVNGVVVTEDDTMKWRGMRTKGEFKLPDDTHPVVVVSRAARRANKYRSTVAHTSHADRRFVAAYWIPAGTRIGWREWYKDNVSLDYYDRDVHLHFHTNTLEEATVLAKLFGYTGTIQDGSQCRVPRAKRVASGPKPTGVVWRSGGYGTKIDLTEIQDPDNDLIYIEGSRERHQDVSDLYDLTQAKLFIGTPPIIIDRYGITQKEAAKRFVGMATDLKTWIARHPDRVDTAKLESFALAATLESEWKSDWVKFRWLKKYGPALKFRHSLGESRLNASILDRYIAKPRVTAQLKAIQKWHDVQFPKLPKTIREFLIRDNYDSYANTLFQLYEEMK